MDLTLWEPSLCYLCRATSLKIQGHFIAEFIGRTDQNLLKKLFN